MREIVFSNLKTPPSAFPQLVVRSRTGRRDKGPQLNRFFFSRTFLFPLSRSHSLSLSFFLEECNRIVGIKIVIRFRDIAFCVGGDGGALRYVGYATRFAFRRDVT